MPDQDQLLARVRKLLAQAEDPAATEAEAEAFNTKAAQLIARHGIDRAMLAAAGKARDEITQVAITIDNPYSMDKAHLLQVIARPLRCRSAAYTSGKSASKVIVLGFESDIERVQLLYTSLLLQAMTQLSHVRPEFEWYESVAAYRRTWLRGFAEAVYRRLRSAEARAAEQDVAPSGSDRSTALVLRDRITQVEHAYHQAFPGVRTARPRKLSGTGYYDGHSAGERANLHNAAPVGSARTVLGRGWPGPGAGGRLGA